MGAILKFITAFVFFTQSFFPLALSQDQVAEKWWPHALWGEGDQAGASNWITPDKVMQAVQYVRRGKVYELGNIYEAGMPLMGNRSFKMTIPSFPTYGPSGDKHIIFNDEFLCTEIGQVGTQFDGPGHVGQEITLADGSKEQVFYNGFTAEDIKSPYGLKKLGAENIKSYVTVGHLIDLAGAMDSEMLDPGYEVSLLEVKEALKKQDIQEVNIKPGDALLFNVGWWKKWPDAEVLQNTPYISSEVVDWIITKQPSMIGSDITLDGPHSRVHLDITMKNGIWNLEWMRFDQVLSDQAYQFMFIFTPLRIKGATGAPGRPIAVR